MTDHAGYCDTRDTGWIDSRKVRFEGVLYRSNAAITGSPRTPFLDSFRRADQPPRMSYFEPDKVLSAIYPLTLCYLT
jgi:hypothetical protein